MFLMAPGPTIEYKPATEADMAVLQPSGILGSGAKLCRTIEYVGSEDLGELQCLLYFMRPSSYKGIRT